MKSNTFFISLLITALTFVSCKKFLDSKPAGNLVVPSEISDLQALLDDNTSINHRNPISDERSADDYYLSYTNWNALNPESLKRMYIWEKDYLFEQNDPTTEWAYLYHAVYRANIVLDHLRKVSDGRDTQGAKQLEGHARFIRAKNFFHAAQIWCLAYDDGTADSDLGIPLRLDADFNKVSTRASLAETYAQILSDCKIAAALLPEKPVHKLRPGKAAAYGLLSRTYIAMRDYANSLVYADSALSIIDTLLDFNKVNASATWPFAPRFSNPEDLINMYSVSPGTLVYTIAKIDSNLYNSYAVNDLRKTVYFRKNNDNSYAFKGSLIGAGNIYTGIAVDEIYLNKAECLARAGNIGEAMTVLNKLLINRWKTGTYIPLNASSKDIAMQIILQERRKELVMRGLRWMDIKRLNKEGANISLTRDLNGAIYKLPANDLRFALPIPEDVIALTGMQQNAR